MGKDKKFEMSVVDEGYEDNYWEKVENEKEKIRKSNKEEIDYTLSENNTILTTRRIIIFVVWALLYKLFIKYEIGTM
jgi:hypothetical protein